MRKLEYSSRCNAFCINLFCRFVCIEHISFEKCIRIMRDSSTPSPTSIVFRAQTRNVGWRKINFSSSQSWKYYSTMKNYHRKFCPTLIQFCTNFCEGKQKFFFDACELCGCCHFTFCFRQPRLWVFPVKVKINFLSTLGRQKIEFSISRLLRTWRRSLDWGDLSTITCDRMSHN